MPTNSDSSTIGTCACKPATFIDWYNITYMNLGIYLLICSDPVMEKKLADEM